MEGKSGIDAAQKKIQGYYGEREKRGEIEDDTREADNVSSRL